MRSPLLEKNLLPLSRMMLIWGCPRMLSCSAPTRSAPDEDELGRKKQNAIKAKGKAEVKAAGTVSALGSCRRAVLSSHVAPPPLSKGANPSPAPRGLLLLEIQLQPLIEVDKLAPSRFRNH